MSGEGSGVKESGHIVSGGGGHRVSVGADPRLATRQRTDRSSDPSLELRPEPSFLPLEVPQASPASRDDGALSPPLATGEGTPSLEPGPPSTHVTEPLPADEASLLRLTRRMATLQYQIDTIRDEIERLQRSLQQRP